jgi:hypothetical protein
MKPFSILLTLLILCVPALAADVDGKWTGNITMPTGDVPVQFILKADGEKLTGSTLGIDGSEVKISDGKVTADGKSISFKVTLDFGGMPFEINYKGVVSPAEIKMTAEVLGMPLDFALKKASEAAAAPAAK